jgi:hypothetical protein
MWDARKWRIAFAFSFALGVIAALSSPLTARSSAGDPGACYEDMRCHAINYDCTIDYERVCQTTINPGVPPGDPYYCHTGVACTIGGGGD